MALARLEKKNSDLAEVEVDEVLGLMSHIAAKIPAHDAVPSGIVFLVKLLQNRSLQIKNSSNRYSPSEQGNQRKNRCSLSTRIILFTSYCTPAA